MSTIDLQKFMELRESVRARQQEAPARKKSASATEDWRTLLESKRQQIGIEKTSRAKDISAPETVEWGKGMKTGDSLESLDQKVEALRDRKIQGLSVRELGNFVDVRA